MSTGTMKKSHSQWSSRMGFMLAAAGSAVGLGNIWKFPYMAGQMGGSAFVLTYLLFMFIIGMPILVLEWLIGRRGQKNPIHTMEDVAVSEGHSKSWRWVGIIGVLGSFLILSFYSVIGGWATDYIVLAAKGTFEGVNGKTTALIFDNFKADVGSLLTWHTVFMFATAFIVALGVGAGLERGCKLMMPGLGILLLVLVGYAIYASGPAFYKACDFLFTPNWSALNGTAILAALGHAFFSLSLGMGIMMAYGSYLGKDVDLLSTARTVVILDVVVAVLSGIAIFPLVFANGLEPAAGPGLIFVTLPIAFGNMIGGTVLGILFFIFLTFAALTSSISLLEPTVELLEEKTHMGRKTATIVISILIWALGIACILSFNKWADVKFFDKNIFDSLDYLTSKIMLPITGLGTVIFGAYMMKQKRIQEELNLNNFWFKIWRVLTSIVIPIAIVAILVFGLQH
ncbi:MULTISPECIES: sodium-dependent transporter [unclassified Gilliamella]|uniref:sodium-dependent transporter n=1 Tax=unclassified Gilliamella TaxID=2685620 RepID=UPI00226A0EE4|nr:MULTISPECIES: sodium-dependent transporter [unclassified Gilliamella]MCX8601899.1 sodium-dependent transporter [Gilliamella sp. B3722]MCX8607875.1 sodium-dependent transporter [Gilliamella sp. B3771]MCX8611165.1 sodium-dependent transporter [Gilliamella sp. B3891]MCX8613711.1 sodium-dependent transporter [Gilliamella sp. B3773]MCX8615000.1 sodium-dependent transporter [Gilliamella sp. B3770]